MAKNKHLGSSLDDFLADEGIINETTVTAVKRTLVWQLLQAMEENGLSISEFAHQLEIDRAAVNRLLDPESPCIHFPTLDKAARALGKRLVARLEEKY